MNEPTYDNGGGPPAATVTDPDNNVPEPAPPANAPAPAPSVVTTPSIDSTHDIDAWAPVTASTRAPATPYR
ncbi:hypothetical protein AB0L34_07935 [Micromonospora sp. NPDC052213]|uniref:hypothetical protein n=1 Tax=Micromonospora sp. NPDC052213 TaxID=3155812 RepID=UPI003446511C